MLTKVLFALSAGLKYSSPCLAYIAPIDHRELGALAYRLFIVSVILMIFSSSLLLLSLFALDKFSLLWILLLFHDLKSSDELLWKLVFIWFCFSKPFSPCILLLISFFFSFFNEYYLVFMTVGFCPAQIIWSLDCRPHTSHHGSHCDICLYGLSICMYDLDLNKD